MFNINCQSLGSNSDALELEATISATCATATANYWKAIIFHCFCHLRVFNRNIGRWIRTHNLKSGVPNQHNCSFWLEESVFKIGTSRLFDLFSVNFYGIEIVLFRGIQTLIV